MNSASRHSHRAGACRGAAPRDRRDPQRAPARGRLRRSRRAACRRRATRTGNTRICGRWRKCASPWPRRSGATAIAPTDLPRPIEGYARYMFVDGVFAPACIQRRACSSRCQPSRPWHAGRRSATAAEGDADARFALLNEAFATDGAYIVAAAGATARECLEFVFVATADAQAGGVLSAPRACRWEPAHESALIERHVSLRQRCQLHQRRRPRRDRRRRARSSTTVCSRPAPAPSGSTR